MKSIIVLLLAFQAMATSLAAEVANSQLTSFADSNFKLVVLESLLESKRLDLGTEEELAEKIFNRAVNLEEEGWELKPEIYKYLTNYPISKSDLSSVTKITFDGGHGIYAYIFYFWGGETEDFDVQSLADLKLFPNLEQLEVISMVNDGDLSSLSTLKNLRILSLSDIPQFYNLEVLLTLPKLTRFEYFSHAIDPKYDDVLRDLKDRGVEVRAFQ